MSATPHEEAERFFAVLPKGLSRSRLAEYDVEASPEQVQLLTKEMLFLSIFWVRSALRVTVPEIVATQILQDLLEFIRSSWSTEFGLGNCDFNQSLKVMEQRWQTYEQITQQGGEPIAVLSEGVTQLETRNALLEVNHQKILALFLDWVPVDEIGEVAAEMES